MHKNVWNKLAPAAQSLGAWLVSSHNNEGRVDYSVQELADSGLGSLSEVLFALYELESRGFGKISGDGPESIFTIGYDLVN